MNESVYAIDRFSMRWPARLVMEGRGPAGSGFTFTHRNAGRETVSGALPLNADGVAAFSIRLRGASCLASPHQQNLIKPGGVEALGEIAGWCKPFRVDGILGTIGQGGYSLAAAGL